MDKKTVSELIETLPKKSRYDINDLVDLVCVLRSEDGCPWDKVQTHKSIKSDFLEEVYEVLEGIDKDDPEILREELGDVLLQVVFHVVIEQEQEHFQLGDVITDLCSKLIIRHPHVFGEVQADNVDTVLSNWDSIKKQTKGQESFTDTLESVPKNFPALMRAQKLSKRASRAGIDFETDKDGGETELFEAIRSQLDKVRAASANKEDASAQMGSLLMLCADLARKLDCDAETVLADSCNELVERFKELEEKRDDLSACGAQELYSY